MTARECVVLDDMEITAPIPRPPRRPVTPFAPEYVGRHRMPGWVARIGSGAIPVHHLTTVERRGTSGTTAALLLLGSLAALFVTVLIYGLLIVQAMPDLSAPTPEPEVRVSLDSPSPTVLPGWAVR